MGLQKVGGTESVGINRHESADERAVRRRASTHPGLESCVETSQEAGEVLTEGRKPGY